MEHLEGKNPKTRDRRTPMNWNNCSESLSRLPTPWMPPMPKELFTGHQACEIFITRARTRQDFGLWSCQGQCREGVSGDANTLATQDVDPDHLTILAAPWVQSPYVARTGQRKGFGCANRPVSFVPCCIRWLTGPVAVPRGHLGLISRHSGATTRGSAAIHPEVPPKLEEIINKALEKDRNLRISTQLTFARTYSV